MTTDAATPWFCHQLGSREHYSIPRALHGHVCLELLQTDAWIPPHVARWMPAMGPLKSLVGRYHEDLATAKVRSFTLGRLCFDGMSRLRWDFPWQSIMKRNEWFQSRCIPGLHSALKSGNPQATIVFSYSYTARKLFREAKTYGAFCVLGQIDPGPEEFRWVAEQMEKSGGEPEPEPPPEYWALWREEVELADRIIVNSDWSMELLCRSGVPAEKMRVIPLAYENRIEAPFRQYPSAWSDQRPLRVLFLGQLIARKGVYSLFEAILALKSADVVFDLAGPIGVEIPNWIRDNNKVTIHGAVSRSKAESLYQAADVFILPTFSDGFAITQLEAAAHGLPLIVSKYCGRVVEDGVNGIVLPDVSISAIVAAIQRFLNDPGLVARLASHPLDESEYSLETLGRRLQALGAELVEEQS